jgi:hypothetical protein
VLSLTALGHCSRKGHLCPVPCLFRADDRPHARLDQQVHVAYLDVGEAFVLGDLRAVEG